MARFNIMARDGQSVRYSGAPKYNGLFGKPSYIEFSEIASATPIEWQVGDYVDYSRTGFRYKLYTIPQVVKSSTSGTAGDAFVYKNVQFYCATKDLEIALFRDIVEYDNGIHFSSIPNVDTYEDVYGIINRIQANMDDFAPGEWTIRAMSTSYTEITDLMSEVKAFSLSDGSCMDALNQIYALWKGLSWIYKVENGKHTIVIGRPNLQDASNTTPEFSYGEGNGLKVITRAVSTKNEMATRIYAYGSDRNLPTRYYNNLTPYIKDHESVYIPHLMLPLTDWGSTGGLKDARLAYIENSTAVNKYGLIPKIMRFDGTGDLEDIYPSVEGMTVGDVADLDFPNVGWADTDPIDTIYACSNPSDNGMYTEDSIKLKQDIVELPVAQTSATYLKKANQEAVTMGNEKYITSSQPYFEKINLGGTNGKITVSMGGLNGTVRAVNATLGDYLTEVPKAFVEIYFDGTLITSTEAKVISTRMQDVFNFECPDVQFTTNANGYIYVYLRVEAKFSDNSPAVTLTYSHTAATVTVKNEYTIAKTFTVFTRQLGFDLNAVGVVADNGIGTLSMKTGWCAGRDFVINSATYDEINGTWALECQRQDDTSLMQYFPNNVYSIDEDDKFVLLDIQMPDKYVTAAMTRLHDAAADALARLCKPVMAYAPEVDSKAVFMATVTLTEGLYMPVYDPDLIETYIISEPNVNWILIDTVTIAENEDVIPIYSVSLRDEKVDSMLQIITGELNETRKRLRDKDTDESRKPAQEDPNTVNIPVVLGVKIQAESKLFVSDSAGNYTGQTITLTAVTQGINNPKYQWYYLSAIIDPEEEGDDPTEVWTALVGETAQAYVVEADSQIYYQDGKTYEDFKVVVKNYPKGEETPLAEITEYSDKIRISKGGRGPKGDDGDPGEDGYSKATITLYRRLNTGDIKTYRISDSTYDFETQELTVVSGGTLNGWVASTDDLVGSGPIYVTSVNVASQDATVSILGNWTTDSLATTGYATGEWSEPVRLTGDNGLIGKVMRGVNVFNPYGIGGDSQNQGVPYQGRSDTDTSHIYYDVVSIMDENGNIDQLYYCEHDSYNGHPAQDYTPGVTTGWQNVWVEATQFDFVATKVLLADNAFIDVLSGNGVYLYGNSGSGGAAPDIVAGMQGGSTTIWPPNSGTTVPQVNFFAGTTFQPGDDDTNYDPTDTDKVYPQTAPFRVDYEGNMFATKGQIGPYTIGDEGLTLIASGYGNRDCQYSIGEFEIELAVGQRHRAIHGDLTPAIGTGLLDINSGDGVFPAITATGDVLVTGDLVRNNESVITFDATNSTTGYDSILHVVHCSQSDYDDMEYYGTLDDETFYIIT